MKYAFAPKDVHVWDNKGEKFGGTHDRYAVVFPDGACFTMSGFPFNEDGFCEFNSMGYVPKDSDVERQQVPLQVAEMISELMI